MEKNLENSNKMIKLLLVIFVIISLSLGGFIIYDKVLKEEEKVICEKCEKCSTSCDCPNDFVEESDEVNSIVAGINEITLTNSNKEILFNGKTIKLRYSDDIVYLNDNKTNVKINCGTNIVSITEKFLLVGSYGCQGPIKYQYALNSKNEFVEVIGNPDTASSTIINLRPENGRLFATKYNNNSDYSNLPDTTSKVEFVYENDKVVIKDID